MSSNNQNIERYVELPTPEEINAEFPISKNSEEFVLNSRRIIQDILDRKDDRKIIILGPCSIHSYDEALEYARFVKDLQEKVKDRFYLVMRTYFEKPRTTIGWKGLIYDPELDGSCNIVKGIKDARKILLDIISLGVPTATEILGVITPQYISDLISWVAIGARTTESQPHRELVSGLSMPVGFKNSTYGDINVAINAMKSSLYPHNFLGIDEKGRASIVRTKGNRYIHIILRGGTNPNYDLDSINNVINILEENELPKNIIIDCSHGNSNKDFRNQPKVFKELISQMVNGNKSVVGMMLESNINEGNQKISDNLEYGVSITDGCISIKTTETIILDAYKLLD